VIYIAPAESTWHTHLGFELYDRLALECAQFAQKGNIFLVGDFNAKTYSDTGLHPIENPSGNEPYFPNFIPQVVHARTSQDHSPIDHFGRRLLEICSNLNLVILNGAIGSDKNRGKFTFAKNLANGNRQRSVIDYFICSYDLIPNILEFDVLKIIDGNFDHRPLIAYIPIKTAPEPDIQQTS